MSSWLPYLLVAFAIFWGSAMIADSLWNVASKIEDMARALMELEE